MAYKLPDELIKEILSPGLKVPDDLFSDMSRTSPFCRYTQSTSTVLLVCKRWLRVATPLLYHVVVLRSKAQAQALEAALRANKGLGLFIRKLRLEGGYGGAMHKILVSAPNVTDLFLSLVIWSPDSVSGLCRSLSSINPTRVILYHLRGNTPQNNAVRQLLQKLCHCIEKWVNLKIFYCPYSYRTYERDKLIAMALSKALKLETVHIPWAADILLFLHTISRNPSIKNIHIGRPPYRGARFQFSSDDDSDARLKALVTFEPLHDEQTIEPDISHLPNPGFIPMRFASDEVRDHIWKRVLWFAMRIEYNNEETVDLQNCRKARINTARMTMLLVSRTFKKLALPYLYGYPILYNKSALNGFSARLFEDPSLGLHLRTLFVYIPVSAPQLLFPILSHAPSLVRLRGIPNFLLPIDGPQYFDRRGLEWDTFVTLARTAGSSLIDFCGLEVLPGTVPEPPSVFYYFAKIRTLEWQSSAHFDCNLVEIPSKALSALESLRVLNCHMSFLQILSHMELPVLHDVTLLGDLSQAVVFLERHGAKIQRLRLNQCRDAPIFDMCPAMSIFLLGSSPVFFDSASFHCKVEHKALVKIVLTCSSIISSEKKWSNFLQSLELTPFPALREIQVFSCKWPTTEREISKSRWVTSAEYLMKWDVRLTDVEGRYWRPRLKYSKG